MTVAFLSFGYGTHDTTDDACRLWDKIFTLRIFDDGNGKMNRALSDVGGGVLIVSQFTLYADCRRGRRPSLVKPLRPHKGNRSINTSVHSLRQALGARASDVVFLAPICASLSPTMDR